MPYRKQQFANGEIYHLVTRGIDENLLFKDTNDYYRGIFSIYEFNNTKKVEIREQRRARAKAKTCGDPVSADMRGKLVEVLVFCFMPNHIHLLLRQLKDGGIVKFMSKLGAGYGGYFNRKYSRKGYVFQNRFIAVPIKNDEQLKVVFAYIHINPVSLIEPKWKEKGIINMKKTVKFIGDYKWSSYLDYIGESNFPSVTDREFILEMMGSEKACKEFTENWIKYKSRIKEIGELALE